MAITKAELEMLAQEVFESLCEGMLDSDIMTALGADPETYAKIRAKAFDLKSDEIRTRSSEHTYVQYFIDQSQNLRELGTMLKSFRKTKQYNAMLGAIKLRSDLTDKLIAKGQELGLIAKRAERREIVAGIVIKDLSNDQLRRTAQRELAALNKMMGEMGDASILDLDPGALHHGPALPPVIEAEAKEDTIAAPTKHARARQSKVSSKARGRPKQRVD